MSRRHIAAFVAVIGLAVTGACSEDNKVGEGLNTEGLAEGQDGTRLGETTTTAAPETTLAPSTTAAAPSTTAKPAAATTTAPPTTAAPQIAITVTITGTAYEPRQAAVRRGALVRFSNTDSKPRKLVAADGSFQSPVINPGSHWDYKADKPGKFDYADPDVPFAQGTLIVS